MLNAIVQVRLNEFVAERFESAPGGDDLYQHFRVSVTGNVANVSLEAGISPQMIFKHYYELVQPDAAKAWFAIVPPDKS